MTGFGRYLVESGGCVQQWEIKSVNGRHLDIKWRLPQMVRHLEHDLEKIARSHASRGRVEISLTLQFSSDAAPSGAFDAVQAMAMLDDLGSLARARGDEWTPDYGALLALPALWSEPEIDQDGDLAATLENGLSLALDDWNESRIAEGAALERDLRSRITSMEGWLAAIADRAPAILDERTRALRERISDNLAAVGATLDEGRFLQEVVILGDRIDVSEELTRLGAHLERLGLLLEQGQDAGRKLDFTLQECFREINTCGNKLADAQLSPMIVDFKNELEKCREQVQNLE